MRGEWACGDLDRRGKRALADQGRGAQEALRACLCGSPTSLLHPPRPRCGPCKMIYPELCEMNAKYKAAGVEIVKFECNKANKELGQKVCASVV